jgi:hypothetical protein
MTGWNPVAGQGRTPLLRTSTSKRISRTGTIVAGIGSTGVIAERYQTSSFQNFSRTPVREPTAVLPTASSPSTATRVGAGQRPGVRRSSAWAPTPPMTTIAVSIAAREAVSDSP